MPYIVTTYDGDPASAYTQALDRRAVATLDDARDIAVQITFRRPMPPYSDQWDDALLALDAMGGTIGPLPDGTMVKVEPISFDAYNAAQEA